MAGDDLPWLAAHMNGLAREQLTALLQDLDASIASRELAIAAVGVVLRALQRHVSPGQYGQVMNEMLPGLSALAIEAADGIADSYSWPN